MITRTITSLSMVALAAAALSVPLPTVAVAQGDPDQDFHLACIDGVNDVEVTLMPTETGTIEAILNEVKACNITGNVVINVHPAAQPRPLPARIPDGFTKVEIKGVGEQQVRFAQADGHQATVVDAPLVVRNIEVHDVQHHVFDVRHAFTLEHSIIAGPGTAVHTVQEGAPGAVSITNSVFRGTQIADLHRRSGVVTITHNTFVHVEDGAATAVTLGPVKATDSQVRVAHNEFYLGADTVMGVAVMRPNVTITANQFVGDSRAGAETTQPPQSNTGIETSGIFIEVPAVSGRMQNVLATNVVITRNVFNGLNAVTQRQGKIPRSEAEITALNAGATPHVRFEFNDVALGNVTPTVITRAGLHGGEIDAAKVVNRCNVHGPKVKDLAKVTPDLMVLKEWVGHDASDEVFMAGCITAKELVDELAKAEAAVTDTQPDGTTPDQPQADPTQPTVPDDPSGLVEPSEPLTPSVPSTPDVEDQDKPKPGDDQATNPQEPTDAPANPDTPSPDAAQTQPGIPDVKPTNPPQTAPDPQQTAPAVPADPGPAPQPAPAPAAPAPAPMPTPTTPAPSGPPIAAPGLPGPDVKPDSVTVARISGESRVETAVKIAEADFKDGAEVVVIARADVHADSVSAAPLANHYKAPVLLTQSDSLHPAVLAELKRLQPKGGKVILMGGEVALSTAVEAAVVKTGGTVERVAGVNRAATAVKTAEHLGALGKAKQVLVADGADWQPSLIAGPAAVVTEGVTLLTNGGAMAPETTAYLSTLKDPKVITVGSAAAQALPTADAITGEDASALSVAVARAFFTSPKVVGVATTEAFADALTGGVHIARQAGPLMLLPTKTPASVQSWLTATPTLTQVYVYGGAQRISPEQADDLTA